MRAHTHTHPRSADFIKKYKQLFIKAFFISCQDQPDKQDSYQAAKRDTIKIKIKKSSTSFQLFTSALLTGTALESDFFSPYEAFQSATTSNKQVHCTDGILHNLEGFQRKRGRRAATFKNIATVFKPHNAPACDPHTSSLEADLNRHMLRTCARPVGGNLS